MPDVALRCGGSKAPHLLVSRIDWCSTSTVVLESSRQNAVSKWNYCCNNPTSRPHSVHVTFLKLTKNSVSELCRIVASILTKRGSEPASIVKTWVEGSRWETSILEGGSEPTSNMTTSVKGSRWETSIIHMLKRIATILQSSETGFFVSFKNVKNDDGCLPSRPLYPPRVHVQCQLRATFALEDRYNSTEFQDGILS